MDTIKAEAAPAVSPERTTEVDEIIGQARGAADAFRKLGQPEVDAIVSAMVVAGLEAAVDLAQTAVEETGFGVFEDKVVKNYVATEFLYDYLKDKKSVGVIDSDPDLDIDYVADPVGVVLAITPITNPTSTVLFKAIVAAKTRNAVIFRPAPGAVRCAERAVEMLREAGEKVGLRSLREAGVNEETYLQARADLARAAFTDPSMRTNPRMPLIREILDLLDAGYYGRPDAAAPAS